MYRDRTCAISPSVSCGGRCIYKIVEDTPLSSIGIWAIPHLELS